MCLPMLAPLGAAMGASATSAAAVGTMMAASLAGSAISAYGAYQQGQTSKALGEYNAKAQENNAIAQNYAADDAIKRGQIAEDAQRDKVRQIQGAQRVAIAAGGGDLTDPTSSALLADTAGFGELDALTVRSNAAKEAWGYKVGADNALAQAGASRFQGSAASRAGMISAGGSLLSGATSAYGMAQTAINPRVARV